jgi:peptide deformylase
MKLLKIAKLGNPVLRIPAKEIAVNKIDSQKIQELIDGMVATLREDDGVGLAGPQVHQPLRIFIAEVAKNPRYPEAGEVPLTVFINPKILATSKKKVVDWEGCLSIPDVRGMVPRHEKVTVQAYDREGKKFSQEAEGFLARIIQHENDHLDGVLFLDRMTDLRSLTFLKEFQRYWLKKE